MISIANTIIYENITALEQALKHVPDLNHIDEYGFTPLIETAIVNDTEKAKLLLKRHADPNMKDLLGGTALHWAVENKNTQLCKLLLNHSANPNIYTNASEAPLVKALLRHDETFKTLLCDNGANLTFAQDFIFTKLLGHRYALRGYTDLVDTNGEFTEINFEGFFLEFSLGLVQHSLQDYKKNYAAKSLRFYFEMFEQIIAALSNASELIKYQQYRIDIKRFQSHINNLLQKPLLILPISFEGHAITLIKYKNILIKCDRRSNKDFLNGIIFYEIGYPGKFHKDLMKFLLYQKKTSSFIEKELPKLVGLKQLGRLLIEPQMTGNCSWANVEACLPACLSLFQQKQLTGILDYKINPVKIFHHWREWDRMRALHFFMHDFPSASPARKASIASIVAAIFFQRLRYQDPKELELAKKIFSLLKTPGYEYVLDNYIEIYCYKHPTKAGAHLKKLIQACEELI
jgi:hypothetical protein